MIWSVVAVTLIIVLLLIVIIILAINQTYFLQQMQCPISQQWEEDENFVDPIIEEMTDSLPEQQEQQEAATNTTTTITTTMEKREGYYKPKGLVREQLVCQTLEKLYNKGFPTTRPAFLKNPETGQLMEYDCYNKDLKIAAEHNGEQHYHFPNTFHKSIDEFQAQVRRDKYKYNLSTENGIYQITVPYWVPLALIPKWIEYYCPDYVTTRNKIEKLINEHN